jgi:hypothetical protein
MKKLTIQNMTPSTPHNIAIVHFTCIFRFEFSKYLYCINPLHYYELRTSLVDGPYQMIIFYYIFHHEIIQFFQKIKF